MEQTIKFLFFFVLGTTWASYPYPIYRPVDPITPPPRPVLEYGVPIRPITPPKQPEEVYGLPRVRVPSSVYGVPKIQIPSTSYGVPVQKVAVPRRPFLTYEAPTLRTFQLDYSGEDGDDDNVGFSRGYELPKPQKPYIEYGVPTPKPERPATVYGPPPAKPFTRYGVPEERSVPLFQSVVDAYELPRVKVPSVVYGVPR